MRGPFHFALLAVLVALPTLAATGCSGEVSFTTASLSEATMASGTDEDARPIGPTDVFDISTPEVFCSVKLSNAPSDTEVTAEWIYEDSVLNTYTITADGTRYLSFSLTPPASGWPAGQYRVVLYVDGKEETSLDFTVEGGSTQSPGTPTPTAATVSEATTALGVNSVGAPVNETTTFPQDTPTIYCSVLVSGITTPVDLLSEWYYVQGALEGVTNQLIDSVPISVPEDQYVWFSLDMPDNGWPAGEYEFVLYMNGALAVELPFTVVAPGATGTSIKLSEATTAVNIDSSARPVGPTSAFQAGTGKVYVTFVAAPDVAPGSTVVSEWYAMSSGSPVLMDSFSLDVTPGHYHALYYEIPGGWPAGQYAVILYLGGVQQAVLAFSVA